MTAYRCTRCGGRHDAATVSPQHAFEVDGATLCIAQFAGRYGRRRIVVTRRMRAIVTPTRAERRRVDAGIAALMVTAGQVAMA